MARSQHIRLALQQLIRSRTKVSLSCCRLIFFIYYAFCTLVGLNNCRWNVGSLHGVISEDHFLNLSNLLHVHCKLNKKKKETDLMTPFGVYSSRKSISINCNLILILSSFFPQWNLHSFMLCSDELCWGSSEPPQVLMRSSAFKACIIM